MNKILPKQKEYLEKICSLAIANINNTKDYCIKNEHHDTYEFKKDGMKTYLNCIFFISEKTTILFNKEKKNIDINGNYIKDNSPLYRLSCNASRMPVDKKFLNLFEKSPFECNYAFRMIIKNFAQTVINNLKLISSPDTTAGKNKDHLNKFFKKLSDDLNSPKLYHSLQSILIDTENETSESEEVKKEDFNNNELENSKTSDIKVSENSLKDKLTTECTSINMHSMLEEHVITSTNPVKNTDLQTTLNEKEEIVRPVFNFLHGMAVGFGDSSELNSNNNPNDHSGFPAKDNIMDSNDHVNKKIKTNPLFSSETKHSDEHNNSTDKFFLTINYGDNKNSAFCEIQSHDGCYFSKIKIFTNKPVVIRQQKFQFTIELLQ